MRSIFLCLLFGILACANDPAPSDQKEGSEATETTQPEVTKNRIVFFGNSLTAAYGLDPEQGFVALIGRKLDSLDLPYQVVNAGLSGETTAGGLQRVDWILQQPVHIFVLELGANDGLRGIDPSSTFDNLAAIIDKVRDKHPNADILLTGMESPPNMGADYTKEFRSVFTRLSREKEVELLPFLLEGVAGDPSLNLGDGIHPNAAGHRIVAEHVFMALEPLL